MNHNELKQIAHGLKKSRPPLYERGDALFRAEMGQWNRTVNNVADALHLQDKPCSNFLAACGLLHADEDPMEPGEVQA